MSQSVYPHGPMADEDECGQAMFIPASPGMSMREWYATHAPVTPPGWFVYEAGKPPSLPSPEQYLTPAQRKDMDDLLNDRITPEQADPAVLRFAKTRDDAERNQRRWEAETRKKTYFAWRFAYADMMIAEGAK